jgi:coproporphyrinogen III oxidase-like Fe-S oxidoreductase
MLIENFLTFCSARLIRRYLSFEKYLSALPPQPDKDRSYLLYMHIPFCEQLCPYCSFVSVKFDPSLACQYFDALKKEIEIYHELGYRFDSVYIGGGTPTILPDRLAQIIEFVKSTWQIKQISMETNPNHLVPEVLGILKDIGINRLSVGVQSFNNEILESIERLEKCGCGEEIKRKISSVVGMFDTVNIDMIFNFPNQTEQMLAADVRIIKELKPDQVTYYPFIVSNFKKDQIAQRCGKIDYRQERRLYQLVAEQLSETYNQESVWCFSNKKGLIDEYIVDHDEYVGLGPGSWGYLNGTMYSNTFSVQHYISLLSRDRHPVTAYRSFSRRERMHYYLLLKLLDGSLNLSVMKKEFGNHLWLELLFLLITRSATFHDNNITLTPRGRYYWVILMRTLFSLVGDHRAIYTSLDTAAALNSPARKTAGLNNIRKLNEELV